MKGLKFLGIAAIFCLALTSCSNSGSGSNSGSAANDSTASSASSASTSANASTSDVATNTSVVGYWLVQDGTPQYFKEDGTCESLGSRTRSINGEVVEETYFLTEGKYKVSGNELTLISDDGDITCNYEINGDVLTLTLGDQTVTGKRITEDEYNELIKMAK